MPNKLSISKERTAELMAQFGKNPQDSGSAEVQVAILSERIKKPDRAPEGTPQGSPHPSWPAHARR